MIEAAYERCNDDYCYHWELIKPTGRWKIKYDAYNKGIMYIEKQGWFFKYWIHEDNIEFHPAPHEEIFECQKNQTSPQ